MFLCDHRDPLSLYGFPFPSQRRYFPTVQIGPSRLVGNELVADLFLYLGKQNSSPPIQMKNKLRELRAAREWSQSDLADQLGVSRQTVNAIETERYDPSLPLAFKVARLLKKPIEEIF